MSQYHNGLLQRNIKQGRSLRAYFFENPPGVFRFFTLPLGIPDKTRIYSQKLLESPQKILSSKTKTPGNSTCFFLFTPGNSTFFSISPPPSPHPPPPKKKNQLAISSMPLEIPYPQPPLFVFFLKQFNSDVCNFLKLMINNNKAHKNDANTLC